VNVGAGKRPGHGEPDDAGPDDANLHG
jgi:hypothetical protein